MEGCATSALRLPKYRRYKLLSLGYGIENVQIQILNNFFFFNPFSKGKNSEYLELLIPHLNKY